jgi:hypothetical protein
VDTSDSRKLPSECLDGLPPFVRVILWPSSVSSNSAGIEDKDVDEPAQGKSMGIVSKG